MRTKTRVVVCPRCNGDGEEVGAPVELDGVWLCSLCNGTGEVPEGTTDEDDD